MDRPYEHCRALSPILFFLGLVVAGSLVGCGPVPAPTDPSPVIAFQHDFEKYRADYLYEEIVAAHRAGENWLARALLRKQYRLRDTLTETVYLNYLAAAHYADGDFAEAARLYQRCATARQGWSVQLQADVAAALRNYAIVKGRDAARRLCRQLQRKDPYELVSPAWPLLPLDLTRLTAAGRHEPALLRASLRPDPRGQSYGVDRQRIEQWVARHPTAVGADYAYYFLGDYAAALRARPASRIEPLLHYARGLELIGSLREKYPVAQPEPGLPLEPLVLGEARADWLNEVQAELAVRRPRRAPPAVVDFRRAPPGDYTGTSAPHTLDNFPFSPLPRQQARAAEVPLYEPPPVLEVVTAPLPAQPAVPVYPELFPGYCEPTLYPRFIVEGSRPDSTQILPVPPALILVWQQRRQLFSPWRALIGGYGYRLLSSRYAAQSPGASKDSIDWAARNTVARLDFLIFRPAMEANLFQTDLAPDPDSGQPQFGFQQPRRQLVDHYAQGFAAFERGDLEGAYRLFEQVDGGYSREQQAEAYYLRCYILAAADQLAAARELTLAANRQLTDQPYWVARCVLLLADIFYLQNELPNARAALEALLENYTGDEALLQQARQKLAVVAGYLQPRQPSTPTAVYPWEGGSSRGGPPTPYRSEGRIETGLAEFVDKGFDRQLPTWIEAPIPVRLFEKQATGPRMSGGKRMEIGPAAQSSPSVPVSAAVTPARFTLAAAAVERLAPADRSTAEAALRHFTAYLEQQPAGRYAADGAVYVRWLQYALGAYRACFDSVRDEFLRKPTETMAELVSLFLPLARDPASQEFALLSHKLTAVGNEQLRRDILFHVFDRLPPATARALLRSRRDWQGMRDEIEFVYIDRLLQRADLDRAISAWRAAVAARNEEFRFISPDSPRDTFFFRPVLDSLLGPLERIEDYARAADLLSVRYNWPATAARLLDRGSERFRTDPAADTLLFRKLLILDRLRAEEETHRTSLALLKHNPRSRFAAAALRRLVVYLATVAGDWQQAESYLDLLRESYAEYPREGGRAVYALASAYGTVCADRDRQPAPVGYCERALAYYDLFLREYSDYQELPVAGDRVTAQYHATYYEDAYLITSNRQ